MIISKNKEIHKFLNQKNFKKIFILSGKNSYFKSGANKIFDNLLVEKKTMFYFKKSFYPDIKELKVIIEKIDLFNPDLVIGIGGGCVIDYVKIARVIKDNINLATQILDSSFKIKKKKIMNF